MFKFIQPKNIENDLMAILEGYEQVLQQSPNWLAEAFQKDIIQNSWDARVNRKGKEWSCILTYLPSSETHPNLIVVSDTGTYGLTGRIPKSKEEEVEILQQQDKNDRLAFFLSSNWSNKPEEALGTRGRGKMLFIGASKEKTIYFESLRLDDQEYVFGKIFLNKNTKEIENEFYLGDEANRKRREIFYSILGNFYAPGTRIFIIQPEESLIRSFLNGDMEALIQKTWWEILHKYNVNITVEAGNKKVKIEPSSWLPVNKVEKEYVYDSGLVELDEGLRIKNISLAYLGDKDLPEAYRGIAIQRGGMTIQRIAVKDIIDDAIGEKIYGVVEMDQNLEKELLRRRDEGPEHCSIHWSRVLPRKIKKALRNQILDFIRKFNLTEREEKHIGRAHKQAGKEAEKELNDLARKLGLLGEGIGMKRKTVRKRLPDEKIRLSIADFKTPSSTGRVNFGQSVRGTYVIPINETETQFRVFVKVRIFNEAGDIIKKEEKEITIPDKETVKVVWEKTLINKGFLPGKYTFRAEIFAGEEKDFTVELGKKFEKGERVYHPVSRNFYVEMDPPEEEGLFKINYTETDEREKYVWLEQEDRGYLIWCNMRHPDIKPLMIRGEQNRLREFLIREGVIFLYALVLAEDKARIEEGKEPLVFRKEKEMLLGGDFEGFLEIVGKRRSIYLWERRKSWQSR